MITKTIYSGSSRKLINYVLKGHAHFDNGFSPNRNYITAGKNIQLLTDDKGHKYYDAGFVNDQFKSALSRAKNPKRKTKAIHLIFSFSSGKNGDFPLPDKNDKKELNTQARQAMKLTSSYMLKRFPKNSMWLLAVQRDGRSHMLHVHAVVSPILENGRVFNTNLVTQQDMNRQVYSKITHKREKKLVKGLRTTANKYMQENFPIVCHRTFTPVVPQNEVIVNQSASHNRYSWLEDLRSTIYQSFQKSSNLNEFIDNCKLNGVTVKQRKQLIGKDKNGQKQYRKAFTYSFYGQDKTKKGKPKFHKTRDFIQWETKRKNGKKYYVKVNKGLGKAFTPDYLESALEHEANIQREHDKENIRQQSEAYAIKQAELRRANKPAPSQPNVIRIINSRKQEHQRKNAISTNAREYQNLARRVREYEQEFKSANNGIGRKTASELDRIIADQTRAKNLQRQSSQTSPDNSELGKLAKENGIQINFVSPDEVNSELDNTDDITPVAPDHSSKAILPEMSDFKINKSNYAKGNESDTQGQNNDITVNDNGEKDKNKQISQLQFILFANNLRNAPQYRLPTRKEYKKEHKKSVFDSFFDKVKNSKLIQSFAGTFNLSIDKISDPTLEQNINKQVQQAKQEKIVKLPYSTSRFTKPEENFYKSKMYSVIASDPDYQKAFTREQIRQYATSDFKQAQENINSVFNTYQDQINKDYIGKRQRYIKPSQTPNNTEKQQYREQMQDIFSKMLVKAHGETQHGFNARVKMMADAYMTITNSQYSGTVNSYKATIKGLKDGLKVDEEYKDKFIKLEPEQEQQEKQQARTQVREQEQQTQPTTPKPTASKSKEDKKRLEQDIDDDLDL